jgi:UDP-glucose 4-epimerase
MKHNRQGFLGWFVRLAVQGREIQIYGDGQQLRDLCYVDDVVDAFLRVGASEEADGEVFNLGGTEPISLLDLARLIVEIAGQGQIRLVPWPEDRKRIAIGDVYSSYARIESALGWRPVTDPRVGFEQTIAYYRKHWRHYW